MTNFIRRLWASLTDALRPKQPWEQYLAEATDICDLERRLRVLCR